VWQGRRGDPSPYADCLLVDARMGDAGVMSVHYCIIRWMPAFTGLKMTVPLFVEGSS
jgi:hypothetical protein